MIWSLNDKEIENWLKLAEYDFQTAKSMMSAGRYIYVAFTCQQAIEKILKALYVKEQSKPPPYTHNLKRLTDELSISGLMDEDKIRFLDILNSFYIESRYAVVFDELNEILTTKETQKLLAETERLYLWLKEKIK